MKITRLGVAGLRGFEQAEFKFHPRFTLLVGVNGVGKTSALEAVRTSLSHLLRQFTASHSRPISFDHSDIRVGSASLTVELGAVVNGEDQRLLIHKAREQTVPHMAGDVRNQTLSTPDRMEVSPGFGNSASTLKKARVQPLGVYFATRRSLVTDNPSKTKSERSEQARAFSYALGARRLLLADFAMWMNAQSALALERPEAARQLENIRAAARRFLPECEDISAEVGTPPRLVVQKRGVKLDARQLSDGERSVLALVFDLARRLSQANPGLADPIKDGTAVVLIDELDLHMHPQWQRQVVELLTTTFPNCQFVATTHAPLVIGATQPESVILMEIVDGRVVPQPCGQAFGLDTNEILGRIMGTDSRPPLAREAIEAVETALESGDLAVAREQLAKLRKVLHGDDAKSAELEATINNLEALADEAD